jgi:CRISPR/Cas system-associated exonuclease Cas4 (RecB family)
MARISALKVRVFDSCRLRYRYQYVDRIPARLRPGDTAGSLVHRILCDFFSKVRPEERARERLLLMFSEGWEALSSRYRKMPGVDGLREAGVRQLENFAQRHDLRAAPFMVEPYFQVEIEPGITLFGRLDRIDEEPDGTLHIIDYKTGEQPDEVDPGQLRLYAIMTEEKLGRTVSRASFWYLDDGQVWTMDLSADDKAQARAELLATAEVMTTVDDFPPTIGPHCGHCPYLYACEFREEIARRREDEGWG